MDQENVPSQEPQVPEQPSHPPLQSFPKKRTGHWGVIFVAVVILMLAGGAFGFWKMQQNNTPKQQSSNNQNFQDSNAIQVPPDNNPLPLGPDNSTTTPGAPAYDPNADPLTQLGCTDLGPVLPSISGLMQWQNPQLVKGFNMFTFSSGRTEPNGYDEYYQDFSYVVGHFVSGQYQGGDLLVTNLQFNEPGGPSQFRIVKQGNTYTVLGKYSSDLPDPKSIKYKFKLQVDNTFDLADLDFPKELHTQDPKADFTLPGQLGFFVNGRSFFCADSVKKIFTDPVVGDVYTTQTIATSRGGMWPSFGFYAKSPDGMYYAYQLTVPFVGDNKLPLVTWSNGGKNTQEYSFQAVGGCGAGEFLDVYDVDQNSLVAAGTTFDGQTVYLYKNSHDQELQDMYNEMYVPDTQTKISYDAFVASRPVFFWQDQFGQFVRFKASKYQPLAECAKPVIYLYPQQTEKVSVDVAPVGGFTYTEPNYNQGWNVVADPLSNITNLADGKTYPYLFWEGRGGMYQTPDRGFVVLKNGVHQLLEDKLSLLGLNSKERKDFEEFWEPKMQSSPYYFVTFMGNAVMDQIAPLSITPTPDTIIRVLMDFVPLNHEISVPGFDIRTPQRKGFTVVEWGGVLRK